MAMDAITTNGLPKAMFSLVNDDEKGFSIMGIIESTQHLVRTLLTLAFAVPKMVFNYFWMIFQSFLGMISYHVFWWTTPNKPFHGDLFMVIGADSGFGRAFSTQIVKMSGTVICVDSDKERGELFVKALNDSIRDLRAYFYQCDVRSETELKQVIDLVTKDIGDISVLLNCSMVTSLVSAYFDVYRHVLKVMRSNKKGKLVFIRTFDKGSRDAILGLHDQVRDEIRETRTKEVSTVIAHVYPSIISERNRNGIFGYTKPEEVSRTILEGIAKDRSVIYLPGFMIFVGFYMKFLPSPIVHAIESLLFDDKNSLQRPPVRAAPAR